MIAQLIQMPVNIYVTHQITHFTALVILVINSPVMAEHVMVCVCFKIL